MAQPEASLTDDFAQWWPVSSRSGRRTQLWKIGFVTPADADGLRAANGTGFYALRVGLRWDSHEFDDERYYIELTGTAAELRKFIRWAAEYEHELHLAERFRAAPFMNSRALREGSSPPEGPALG